MPRDVELANFAVLTNADDPERFPQPIDMDALNAALDLFHQVTDWTAVESKYAGALGVLSFSRLSRGATPEAVQVELPELDGIKPVMLDPRWLNPTRPPVLDGPPVIGLDVNGQYLGSASMELGTGRPRHVDTATTAREILTEESGKWRDIPAYGWLAEDLPVGGVFGTLPAGAPLVGPVMRYLADDLELPVPLSRALVWDEHRRWLHRFYEQWRGARMALTGHSDLAYRYAMSAVKSIPNTFIGGWMRSTKYNQGSPTLNIGWCHHVIARARMNAIRSAGKATNEPVGMIADTVYFYGREEISGLEVVTDGRLGKWKVERVAPVTPEIIAAHAAGRPHKFRDAVNASHEGK